MMEKVMKMRGQIALMFFLFMLAGCRPNLPTIAPVGLAPAELATIIEWTADYRPSSARNYSIRPWRYRNELGGAAGRARVSVAPPDSLRFDYQGPLRKSGKAAVVGDSALWVVPDEDFGALVSFAPLFWAALGVPQLPPPGTEVFAMERPDLKAWRFLVRGDTLNFVLRGNPAVQLLAEIRRAGHTIGRAEVELDPVTHLPIKARIDMPFEPSFFELTVIGVDTTVTLEPSIWSQNN